MASAFVLAYDNYVIVNGSMEIQFRAAFIGLDVPGGSGGDSMQAAVDPTANPTQIKAAIASAIRAYAIAHGFTVPSNGITLAEVSKA